MEHPFYDKVILRDKEQAYIQKLLTKYRHEPVSEELKAKIWDELQMEKHKGNITIPFKVIMQRDPSQKQGDYIEILLDTKV